VENVVPKIRIKWIDGDWKVTGEWLHLFEKTEEGWKVRHSTEPDALLAFFDGERIYSMLEGDMVQIPGSPFYRPSPGFVPTVRIKQGPTRPRNERRRRQVS
jgi:hypothetical protein